MDWIKNNIIAIVISTAGIIASFSVYGYRIDELDRRVTANTASITSIQVQSVQMQVALAQIQTDLTYIKAAVDRFTR